jgi:general secretion pathway protein K
MSSNMGDDKGSVTILMAMIAAVILTIGLGFNWLVKEHMRTSEGLKEKAAAIVKARSAYDTLSYLLFTGRIMEGEIIFEKNGITTLRSIPLDGTEIMLGEGVSVRVQDSNGRLSLTTLNPEALERLVRNESDASTGAVFTASFLDWTDRDDTARMNGAEARYYEGQGSPYHPRNYDVQYLSELAFIRGMDEDLFRRVSSSITILPTTGFNPNTASDAVLKAFLNINDSGLASIRNYLKQNRITSKEELFRLTGKIYQPEEGQLWFIPSYQMDIEVSVGAPRSLYRIKAGLTAAQAVFYPSFIHYWQEG